MILRLFNLLDGSNYAPYAVEAIRCILRLQHISFGSDVGKNQFLHHLRFCIDYLRRCHLLDQEGKPINLLEIASHLYYTEPSNLAMTVLLQSGVVHDICSQTSSIDAKRDLMVLLCHLFGRRYLPWVYATTNNIHDLVQRGPSRVVLPPLHPAARRVLAGHQKETLGTFGAYALAFSSRYADELGPDNQLPVSGRVIGPSDASTRPETAFFSQLAETAIQPEARSIFVANSGHNDTFGGVEELVRTVRHGVHLNEHAIPTIERILNPKLPLNAYLYDFFVHGQDDALVNMNGIRRGELWYALDTFHRVLTTIRGDLENLLRMSKDAAPHQGETDVAEMSEDNGYHTFNSTEWEEDEADPAAFNRPRGVSDRDWRVYEVVNSITSEFGAKFKAMWA
jgi:ATP-dependent RNA helicase DDX60